MTGVIVPPLLATEVQTVDVTVAPIQDSQTSALVPYEIIAKISKATVARAKRAES